MKLLAVLGSFFLVSCSFADERITDHAVLYYNDLTLISKNGTCVLQSIASSKTTKFTLQLKPPCYFLRDRKTKNLDYYTYPRLDADFVVIMFGNPISDEERKTRGLKKDDVCGSTAQGMIILNNNVRISEKVSTGLSCTDGGHDEKDFWYFAKHS